MLPGAGDELQGLKKGVMEIADAILVNKADGKGREAAELARAGFEQVLHYLRPATQGWATGAFTCSALTGEGIEGIWRVVETFIGMTKSGGVFDARRADQERMWVRSMVREGLDDLFHAHPGVQKAQLELEEQVASGALPATTAARRLLDLFRDS